MIPRKISLENISPTAMFALNLEKVLGEDLTLVRARLQQALQSGYPLADGFLQEHLHEHHPRAIIVLATSRMGHAPVAKRVALAAAIEMLHMAINVHDVIPRGMLARDRDTRTMLGASILIGDYCFSKASGLAAETENPAVVAAFANALAQLAERRVVTLTETPTLPHIDEAVLYAAAAESAALLVGLPLPIRYALREAALAFGEVLTDSETSLQEALAHLEGLIKDRPLAKPLVNWMRSRGPA
ncbi:MAG: hypothetical protein GXP37_02565 [Chloroflexi bacterium]|nr:hypothetical protein [Chloroflexota bacterium]